MNMNMNRNMSQDLSLAQQSGAQRSFLTRTYLWMTLGLLVTAVVAYTTASSTTLQNLILGTPIVLIGLVIVQLVAVLVLSFAINRMPPALATLIFFGYAALTGLTFSSIVLLYTPESLGSTFVVTAGVFGILSIIGMSTHYDLTGLGTLAFVGLLGVLGMSVLNFFLNSEPLYWIISVAGIIIFLVLIARDSQILKKMASGLDVNSEQGQRASIMGALRLYLDFINLFLFLLRFMGRRN